MYFLTSFVPKIWENRFCRSLSQGQPCQNETCRWTNHAIPLPWFCGLLHLKRCPTRWGCSNC